MRPVVGLLRFHGGGGEEGVLDFSEPVNPCAPRRVIEAILAEGVSRGVVWRYPRYSYEGVRHAIGELFGVDWELVTPVNGAAEAYQLLASLPRFKRIVVFAPSFGEHLLSSLVYEKPLYMIPLRRVGRAYTLTLEDVEGLPNELFRDALVVLSNPNNPTGACIPGDVVEAIESRLSGSSLLLLDESFKLVSWGCGGVTREPGERIVVVVSLTKVLGAPGLRVGFVIDASGVVEAARQPWNLNALAAFLVERLVDYRRELLDSIECGVRVARSEAARLSTLLEQMGCRVFETHAPLLLVEHSVPHPEAGSILAKAGVRVRPPWGYWPLPPTCSRVSILGPSLDNRLVEAFEATGLCRGRR